MARVCAADNGTVGLPRVLIASKGRTSRTSLVTLTGVTINEGTSPAPKPGPPHPAKGSKIRVRKVEEISAGGLVLSSDRNAGLLIGRRDKRGRTLWSLPKGHIEPGETPEDAALREVAEETGIQSAIARSLGVIDFWFMADGKRIHKTVHHFLFTETGGHLSPQPLEVDEVAWFPVTEVVSRLAYSDERKLLAGYGDLAALLD
jgi:ADP-ribose pyrophosphatase YjhB (NUDIX family)